MKGAEENVNQPETSIGGATKTAEKGVKSCEENNVDGDENSKLNGDVDNDGEDDEGHSDGDDDEYDSDGDDDDEGNSNDDDDDSGNCFNNNSNLPDNLLLILKGETEQANQSDAEVEQEDEQPQKKGKHVTMEMVKQWRKELEVK